MSPSSCLRLALVLLAAAAPAAAAKRLHVAVPDIAWEELFPYVRAHVVAEVAAGELRVRVAAGEPRPPEEASRPELLDLARVLLLESGLDASPSSKALGDAVEEVRAAWHRSKVRDAASAEALLWRALEDSPDFLPDLRARFERARKERRLRCRACERDPALRPATLERR